MALKFWQDNTCLKFNEDANAMSRLQFFKGDGCWSYIGKTINSEPQSISIGDGCEHVSLTKKQYFIF